MACGMCYTRAGDADLLRRGHWLGCFSIEYERGVVGVEGELLISTGSYYEGVQHGAKLLFCCWRASSVRILAPVIPCRASNLPFPFPAHALSSHCFSISRFLIKIDAFARAVDLPLLLHNCAHARSPVIIII